MNASNFNPFEIVRYKGELAQVIHPKDNGNQLLVLLPDNTWKLESDLSLIKKI